MSKCSKNFGHIGVLMGGISSERAISLKSGQAVTEALLRQKLNAVAIDITSAREEEIVPFLRKSNIELAFIALHGKLGEDGVIQAILEKMHIPYTGSNVQASRLAMNKALAQDIFRKNNINVPAHVVLSNAQQPDVNALIQQLNGFPIIVKPSCEGSSIGITLVKSRNELAAALQLAESYGDTILIEQYIQGRELTVGILGDSALAVIEICPKHEFFDFSRKYTQGMTDYVVPAKLSENLGRQVQEAALKAHRALGCEDFSRVDIMLDRGENYYVLEINTIPGFTSTSLLPKAALQSGINFDQLCYQLVEMVYGKKKEIQDITLR